VPLGIARGRLELLVMAQSGVLDLPTFRLGGFHLYCLLE
jgi:hypothetical protein